MKHRYWSRRQNHRENYQELSGVVTTSELKTTKRNQILGGTNELLRFQDIFLYRESYEHNSIHCILLCVIFEFLTKISEG